VFIISINCIVITLIPKYIKLQPSQPAIPVLGLNALLSRTVTTQQKTRKKGIQQNQHNYHSLFGR